MIVFVFHYAENNPVHPDPWMSIQKEGNITDGEATLIDGIHRRCFSTLHAVFTIHAPLPVNGYLIRQKWYRPEAPAPDHTDFGTAARGRKPWRWFGFRRWDV